MSFLTEVDLELDLLLLWVCFLVLFLCSPFNFNNAFFFDETVLALSDSSEEDDDDDDVEDELESLLEVEEWRCLLDENDFLVLLCFFLLGGDDTSLDFLEVFFFPSLEDEDELERSRCLLKELLIGNSSFDLTPFRSFFVGDMDLVS